MNAITHESAYCFYPRATVSNESTLVVAKCWDAKALEKYQGRGFTVFGYPSFDQGMLKHRRTFQSGKHRWADDRHTWRINFNMANAVPAAYALDTCTPTHADALANNSWILTIRKEGVRMNYTQFASVLFNRNYVLAEEEFISTVIEPFFRNRGLKEHLLLPNEHLYSCSAWQQEVEDVRGKMEKTRDMKWYVLPLKFHVAVVSQS